MAVKKGEDQNTKIAEDEGREILKYILGQYFRAKRKKEKLEVRLHVINEDRGEPIGGQGYDAMPHGTTVNNDGAAAILYKLSEIEERIIAQKIEVDKAMVRVMDALDYLPQNSLERDICEERHLDMMDWQAIAAEIPMSVSQCHRVYSKALDTLLAYPRIRKEVEEASDDYRLYIFMQDEARRKRKKQGGVKGRQ